MLDLLCAAWVVALFLTLRRAERAWAPLRQQILASRYPRSWAFRRNWQSLFPLKDLPELIVLRRRVILAAIVGLPAIVVPILALLLPPVGTLVLYLCKP